MDSGTEQNRERLEGEALSILADFIMHQDTITWTSLSLFLTGDIILIGLAYQVRVPGLAFLGLFMTGASFLIFWRSALYLEEYFDLAKEGVHDDDLPIFEVKVPGVPTYVVLLALHVFLALIWIAVYNFLAGS